MTGTDWQATVEVLGWTLLHFCWQGLLVLAGYAAVRRWLGPARLHARLFAGHVALAALGLAPLLSLLALWPAATPTATGAAEVGSVIATPIDGPLARPLADGAIEAALGDGGWLGWLVAAWAAGVLVLALRGVWQWRQLRRICRSAQPVAAPWQQRLDRLVVAFGTRRPQLLESALVTAPLLVGWLKPVILLPAGICLRLPSAQLELLLAHELAHVRRWDFVANLLQIALETLLFYHPAVHWISRRVREDRELCCDDLVADVCNAPIDYARALLAVAEAQVGTPRIALAAGGGQLLQRVERIVGGTEQRRDARPARPAIVALALASLLLVTLGVRESVELQQPLPLPQLSWQALRMPAPVLGVPVLRARPERLELAPARPAVVSAAFEPVETPAAARSLPPMQRSAPQAPALHVPLAASSPLRIEPALPIEASRRASEAAPEQMAAVIKPLRTVAPEYPEIAQIRGAEGEVLLSYRIERGRAVDIQMEADSGHSALDGAAERALRRWRFPADSNPALRQTQAFEFNLGRGRQQFPGSCVLPTGTRICRD